MVTPLPLLQPCQMDQKQPPREGLLLQKSVLRTEELRDYAGPVSIPPSIDNPGVVHILGAIWGLMVIKHARHASWDILGSFLISS